MSSGLQVTLSKTELEALLALTRRGADQFDAHGWHHLTKAQETAAIGIIRGLKHGLADLGAKQAEAKWNRDAPKREAARRAAMEHHAVVDGYTVLGMLGDWADISTDPDRRQWADMFHPDTELREQGEIRRNVWRIFITKGRVSDGTGVILQGDCTETADRAEIEELARRIIAEAAGA